MDQLARLHPAPGQAEALRDRTGRVTQGWRNVFVGAIGTTFGPSVLALFTFGVFVPEIGREFGWSLAQVTFGATIISYSFMLMSLVQGALVQRFSIRRMALLSGPLFGLSFGSLSLLTNHPLHFYAVLALSLACSFGILPVTFLKVTADWFEARLGLAMGLTNLGIGVGAALMPGLVGLIIHLAGWRAAYACLGVMAVAVPWPLTFILLQEHPPGSRRAAASHAGNTLREALGMRPFWILLAVFVLLATASSTLLVHQVKILVDQHVSLPHAAAVQSAMGLALIAGRIITGLMLDRMRAATVMLIFVSGAAFGFALYAAGFGAQLGIVSALAGGLLIGAETDVLGYVVPRYFGRREFGPIYGVIFAAFQFVSGIAIVAVSAWRTQSGSYTAALWTITALMLACAGLLLFLGPYNFAGQPAPDGRPEEMEPA